MSRVHSMEEWKNIVDEYYSVYHTLNIPSNTIYKEYNIGRWIYTMRSARKKGSLTQDVIEWLDTMNMPWETTAEKKNEEVWMQHFNDLKEYYTKSGFSNIPERFIYKGFKLGKWLDKQRERNKKGLLENHKIELLESIGIVLYNPINNLYSTSFPEQAIFFYMKKMFRDTRNRHCDYGFELDIYSKSNNIAIEYDGEKYHEDIDKDLLKNNKCNELGITLFRVREDGCPKLNIPYTYSYNAKGSSSINCLNNCLIELFNDIASMTNKKMPDIDVARDMSKIISNIVSSVPSNWLKMFELYKESVDILGTTLIPFGYTYKGYRVGGWVSTQRQAYKGQRGIISSTQKELLDKTGFVWDVNEYNWNNTYDELTSFIKKNGRVPREVHSKCRESELYSWICWQKKRFLKGTNRYQMTIAQQKKLQLVGVL